jgi:hypothetical protein
MIATSVLNEPWVGWVLSALVAAWCGWSMYRNGRRSNDLAERTVDLAEFHAAIEWKQEQLDELRGELARQQAQCGDDMRRLREAHERGMESVRVELEQVKAVAAMDLAHQIAGPLLEQMRASAPDFAERIATALRDNRTPPRGTPVLTTKE